MTLVADGSCRSCGAPVTWVLTAKGGRMPLNPVPVEDGNVWIAAISITGTPVIGVSLNHDGVPEGQTAFVSHFVTCPNAAQWRKKKR